MKKFVALFLTLILIAICFSGCGNTKTDSGGKSDNTSGKLSVVSTIFPGYDFARGVCADLADLYMLLPPGGESHSFEPSAQDIIKIQNCNLFIYVGGESDSWVDDILSSFDTPVNTVKMLDCVSVAEEVIKEGMEVKEHEHEKSDEQDGEKDEKEYDEHVWTSPQNAIKITEAICTAVCREDSANSTFYSTNCESYVGELKKLDSDFNEFFATVKNKTLIFGDRFPMRYFTDAYSLDYYAAFPGCSSETEPSAETIAFLIDTVKQEKVSTVFYMEFSNHRVADGIAEATGTVTAQLNSCHNVTAEQFKNGVSYVTLMRENLSTFREALA